MSDITPTKAENDGRIAGLDALRAAAIVAVVLMHVINREFTGRHLAQPGWSGSLGYFGVELFFILSGFLIGRILIRIAANDPRPRSWAIFMVRRWMRTLPLYFLWLVVLLVATPPADFFPTAAHYATFTQNLAWPMGAWFPVSWSLAVEEWFYLLFSFVVLALAAGRVPGALPLGCLLFVALPLAGRIFLIPADVPFDVGMREVALARLDAIAYGVVMAWCLHHAPAMMRGRRNLLLFAGIFALVAPADFLTLFHGPEMFAALQPYVLALTPIGFALCIPAALDLAIPSAPARMAIRWLSLRSYGLYIVHLSMIDVAWHLVRHLDLPLLACAPVAILLSAGVAELSYRCLEMPILRLRPLQPTVAAASVMPGRVLVPARGGG